MDMTDTQKIGRRLEVDSENVIAWRRLATNDNIRQPRRTRCLVPAFTIAFTGLKSVLIFIIVY